MLKKTLFECANNASVLMVVNCLSEALLNYEIAIN